MLQPIRALKRILAERRALAEREQRALSEILDRLDGDRPARRPGARAGSRKALACPRCERRFALPMHLGRHLATSHRRRRKAA